MKVLLFFVFVLIADIISGAHTGGSTFPSVPQMPPEMQFFLDSVDGDFTVFSKFLEVMFNCTTAKAAKLKQLEKIYFDESVPGYDIVSTALQEYTTKGICLDVAFDFIADLVIKHHKTDPLNGASAPWDWCGTVANLDPQLDPPEDIEWADYICSSGSQP